MKSKQKSNSQPTVQTLIDGWKLNKVTLASKMNMPVGTFKNKLNENQLAYKFTESEHDQLLEVLRELANDTELVAGVTFNQALSQIIGK